MPKEYHITGKEVPFANGRYLLSHRLGNGSFGDIFEGYDTLRKVRIAVKLEKKKVRYPQLDYESKVYRVLHQPPVGLNEADPEEMLEDMAAAGGEELNPNSKDGGEAVEVTPGAAAAAGTAANGTLTTTPANEAGGAKGISLSPTKGAQASPLPYMVIGIPEIYYFDSEGDYNIMVMELCGPSLEDLFNYCHRRFSLKTVLMIADEILFRIQYLHEKGFIHRDIKPENFVLGTGLKAHILYIIDFGLSKLYWDVKKNMHIPFAEGKPLTGTARYCSTNTHRGYEQSRRDDLESIGFLFVYFLRSSLPWQGIQAKDQQLKTIKIGEKKISTPLEDLCEGLPPEFLRYCQYCRNLHFQDKPDYDYLRGLFRSLGKRYDYCTATVPCANPALLRYAQSTADVPEETTSASADDAKRATVGSRKANRLKEGPVQYDLPDPDPTRGFYDWEFDWLKKRQEEVEDSEATDANGDRSVSKSEAPSANPAFKGE
ncbi:casein kinase I-like 6 [Strigomonas culicis]|uniref:non-specific serine/threonine protein kinase n=1 Tax=Strigomonas culicis TaxID=28005 RepID=S9WF75_9TRYP|nr:casein kinase I [Strigomonas culicis]EPY28580.1 casein kinase I [Strigomonas culicis]EPY34385.1 casein kinase I-like 6 [Strigomonas culicis]|eukprot:EPY20747.1 casein kinase I [Strigomonas culicis]